jgi:hypothetical protein
MVGAVYDLAEQVAQLAAITRFLYAARVLLQQFIGRVNVVG